MTTEDTVTAATFVAERVEESQHNIDLLDGIIRRGTVAQPLTPATREGMYSGFAAKDYAMAYLMQVLRSVAPEVADRAAVDLSEALDMGEAAGITADRAASLTAGDPEAWNLGEVIGDLDDISDGYHTRREVYRYRMLYNATTFNEWAAAGRHDVHKSRLHDDGTVPFGNPDLFKVTAQLPTGQISNHYPIDCWSLFNIPERERSAVWDGSTAAEVADSLGRFLGEFQ